MLVERAATAADARALSTRLRLADQREVLAFYEDIHTGLLEAIMGSTICAAAEIDGEVALLIGCAPSADKPLEIGVPWLVGAPTLRGHGGALTALTQRYVAGFLKRWPVLLNFVDERNRVNVRWLKRLGFTICDPVEIGRHGERFHPFVMRA